MGLFPPKTSKSLGYFPRNIPEVDWIPVDTLASIILDIVHFTTQTTENLTYNIANPQRTTRSSLMNPILQYLGSDIKLVDLSEWIGMLEQIDGTDTSELMDKPALKVLDSFRDMEKEMKEGGRLSLSTENRVAASKTMRGLEWWGASG